MLPIFPGGGQSLSVELSSPLLQNNASHPSLHLLRVQFVLTFSYIVMQVVMNLVFLLAMLGDVWHVVCNLFFSQFTFFILLRLKLYSPIFLVVDLLQVNITKLGLLLILFGNCQPSKYN